MAAVEFKTYPPPPHRGLIPIGFPSQAASPEALRFLGHFDGVAAHLTLQLCDMYRLIFLAQPFTIENLLRCLRLAVGRTHANWIEGCIDLLAAEEEAQEKAKAPSE